MDWPNTARDFGRYLRTSGKAEGTVKTYVYNVAYFAAWCARRECCPQDADRNNSRNVYYEPAEVTTRLSLLGVREADLVA